MPPEESPESKFDRLKKQLQDSILRDYPNPERKGCPGGAVLRELAERPLDRAVEDDPHWQHITHCSECYGEFLAFNNAFRQQAKARRVRVNWGVAVAAIIILVAVLVGIRQGPLFQKRPQNAELAWVKRTVVVPSTNRSADPGDQKPIYLERLPLELTIEQEMRSEAQYLQRHAAARARLVGAVDEHGIPDALFARICSQSVMRDFLKRNTGLPFPVRCPAIS